MKQLCYFVIALTLMYAITCSEMYIKHSLRKNGLESQSFSENGLESLEKRPSSELGKELPNAESYYQGWVNYYHYDNHVTVWRPKHFFKNNNYFAQRIAMSEVQKKDKYGQISIPSKSHFFIVLKKDTLYMFSHRGDTMRSPVDSLYYKYIKPIPEDNYLKGGIHDLGIYLYSFYILYFFRIIFYWFLF